MVGSRWFQTISKHWWWVELGIAWLVAAIMFLPYFGQVPLGLNRDEASLGYTAYSLFRTGHDEHGKVWPVSIQSFGDQKLPGYVYALIPVVGLFGLSVESIRSISLLSSFTLVAAAGVLARQAGENWRLSPRLQQAISLIAMLVVATSPWSLHFSHVAYEANLARALFSWGLIFWLKARQQTPEKTQRLWILGWCVCWAAALLTYHSSHIAIPLFLLISVCWDGKIWLKLPRLTQVIMGAIVVGTIGLMVFGQIWSSNQQKSLGISLFNHDSLHQSAFPYRNALQNWPAVVGKLIANPLTEAAIRVSQNLINVLDADFLFISGTPQTDHNPGKLPLFQLFTAPFMLLGALTAWEKRHSLSARVWLTWLIVSIAAPALTIQPQHTTRFSPGFMPLSLLTALGFIRAWQALIEWKLPMYLKKIVPNLALLCVLLVATWSSTRLWIQYFWVTPRVADNHEAGHLLARTLAELAPNSPAVLTQSPQDSAYIWYLLETQYDPRRLPEHITYYPADDEGFQHVAQLDNIYFEKIDWENLVARTTKQPYTLVLKPSELPIEWQNDSRSTFVKAVYNSRQEVIYKVWILDGSIPAEMKPTK